MIQTADGIGSTTDSMDSMDEVFQVVSFEIGDEEYAVDILEVQEIIRMVEITPSRQGHPYY